MKRFVTGFALIWLVLQMTAPAVPTPQAALAALAATAACAALVAVLQGTPWRELPAALGLTRPRPRALAVATVAAAGCLCVYPVFTALTGHRVTLRDDAVWLLMGVFVYHGLAEELAWRGYTYARLRHKRSFNRAVLASMPLLALTHLPILLTAGPAVGIAAMTVAAVTTWPLAHLYEQAGRSIWAPALVHTAIDTFKLVTVPSEATVPFSLALSATALAMPLAVFPLTRGVRLRPRELREPGERNGTSSRRAAPRR
ncbi:CPBP family intramembrane metalloprotease [Streptomyces actinomycinicus]|uniref:CPBP family intramembrane metalloprotease n=1 Tax=Streptomyces actinomycinicus TaxID=1695166 RepID=A0A937JMF5_9ACTN|nr:CPBP family intramembrane glutamic endopeptidase [Streptomyces actinomycinicus]MBL1083470.1 CPBP family intramembrane metalloprotease [Streptomyces actinomycinicus]